jgi:hypothetical protein
MLSQRRYLYLCSALIVLALTLFYTGQSKILFSEIQFQYYSQGIVLAGEPKDIFDDWNKLIPREDVHNKLYYKKKMEMTQRKDELYVLSEKFLGQSYVVPLPEGLRIYSFMDDKYIDNPVNSWLRIVGVFFFVTAIMGFILERRLYKKRFL